MLSVLSSAYISGTRLPELENHIGKGSIVVEIFKQQILQRVVGTYCFYRSSRAWCDTVIETNRNVNKSRVDGISCWLGKIHLLLEICISSNFTLLLSAAHPSDIKFEDIDTENEFCWVKWYEIIDESILSVEIIDAVLNCSQLQWQRIPVEADLASCYKEYGLFSLESDCAVVQVIPIDSFFHTSGECSTRQAEARNISEGIDNWELDQFYVHHSFLQTLAWGACGLNPMTNY